MIARLVGWIGDQRLDTSVRERIMIGATSDNDVAIRGVSPSHARIVRQGDEYWLEDTGSETGTWVNGERITRACLRHLDVITLGRHIDLLFVVPSSPVTQAIPGLVPSLQWAGIPAVVDDEWKTRMDSPRAPEIPQALRVPPVIDVTAGPKTVLVPFTGPPRAVLDRQGQADSSDAGTSLGEMGPAALKVPTMIGRRDSPPTERLSASDRTTLDAAAGLQLPARLGADSPTSSHLPPATVIGFRDVGAPPTALGFRQPPATVEDNEETRLDLTRPDLRPLPISGVRLSGDLGTFFLPRGRSVVGRTLTAAVQIDSREVSREHAIILVNPSEATVNDNGSANGTTVNGTRVSGPRALVSGDRVSFADFEFRVELARLEGEE